MWAGRAVFSVIAAALVVYFGRVGLDRADKVASSISVVLALIALGAPYLLPRTGSAAVPELDRVEDTGRATATAGGYATTGVDAVGGDRPAHVVRSGDANADGPGSVANTGVQRRPIS
jgi:hypothetical protein